MNGTHLGRASSFNDAHNSSRQQGDWAYRAIDEQKVVVAFIHGQRNPLQGQIEKWGRGSFQQATPHPHSSPCCQEGLELFSSSLTPLLSWELVLQFWASSLFPVLLLVDLAYSQAVPEDIHPFSVLRKENLGKEN